MWAIGDVPIELPLRQGDLLVDVDFPVLKLPLHPYKPSGSEQDLISSLVKKQTVLVLSQCCDNFSGNYAAVAPVALRGGLRPSQLSAVNAQEPRQEGGRLVDYDLDHFRLEPVGDTLLFDERKPWVAHLNRAVSFYGNCEAFRVARRERMTARGRRLLRIKLGLRWARIAEEDIEELDAQGIPYGLSTPGLV